MNVNSWKKYIILIFLGISIVSIIFSLILYGHFSPGSETQKDTKVSSEAKLIGGDRSLASENTKDNFRDCTPFGSTSSKCGQAYTSPQEENTKKLKEDKTDQQQLDEFYSSTKEMVSRELASAFSGNPEAIENMKKIIEICQKSESTGTAVELMCNEIKSRKSEIEAMQINIK